MNYYQQGDVLLFEAKELPKGLRASGKVLYKGQNHSHALEGKFSVLKSKTQTFLKSQECKLVHEEHKPIKLPKGIFELKIVQEYDHFLEESRVVID